MLIYRPRPHRKKADWRRWFVRNVEYTIKFLCIITIPTPVGAAVGWLWGRFVFDNHLNFVAEMREFLAAGWIPSFGIMYGLFTGIIMATVFAQYMEMRMAVKDRDIEKFMRFVDEELSPLWHGIATMMAMAVLAGFAVYDYPDKISGELALGASSYIFALLCFVAYEMDEPRYGFFVIKSIPPEWLEQDPREWRRQFIAEKLKVRVTKTVEVTATAAADTKVAA